MECANALVPAVVYDLEQKRYMYLVSCMNGCFRCFVAFFVVEMFRLVSCVWLVGTLVPEYYLVVKNVVCFTDRGVQTQRTYDRRFTPQCHAGFIMSGKRFLVPPPPTGDSFKFPLIL